MLEHHNATGPSFLWFAVPTVQTSDIVSDKWMGLLEAWRHALHIEECSETRWWPHYVVMAQLALLQFGYDRLMVLLD